jgi:hypothetical protein
MIRFHYGLVAFAVAAGLGLAATSEAAQATIQGDGLRVPAASQNVIAVGEGKIVVGDNYKGNKNWNKGKNNWNKDWGKNDHWKNDNDWGKYDNGKHKNKNWSKNYNNKNWNKNWPKNWSNYNNNWNRNWDNRAYVRNWNRRPYYGEFVGGVVLGSILAATGAGIVPYAPQPNLCWYWADPYMYRGYWDYCY